MRPVPTIWLSAPNTSHGQKPGDGCGSGSPDTARTPAKNTIENGKPNRKRILVAPQVPSGPVRCRCIALRATCPPAAIRVKGIHSVATENMGMTGPAEIGRPPCRVGWARSTRTLHDRIAVRPRIPLSSLRTQGPITTAGRLAKTAATRPLRFRGMGPCVRSDNSGFCGGFSNPRSHHPFGDDHVVDVHVGREPPAVGERAVDHAGLLGDDQAIV